PGVATARRGGQDHGDRADDAPAALPPDAGRDRGREQPDGCLPGPDRRAAAVAGGRPPADRRRRHVRLDDLDYALPPELIAQEPAPERTAARLLVVSRSAGHLEHRSVRELPQVLRPGDLLVLND